MVVTINTDASFYWEKQVGTYAMWIVSNEGTFKHHSAFKNKISDPTEAEYLCILNALTIVKRLKWKVTKLVINTDSLNCVHIITKDRQSCMKYKVYKKIKNKQSLIHQLFYDIGGKDLIIHAKHLRSHQHTKTSRNYVNQWCDDMARYEMDKLYPQKNKINK